MHTSLSRLGGLGRSHGILLILGFPAAVAAATLADFGYRHIPVPSQQPTLVVLAQFTDAPFHGTLNDWDHFVFSSTAPSNTVNGYFQEVSLGRFSYTRGGTIMVSMSGDYRHRNYYERTGHDEGLADLLYCSNIVYRAMTSPDFRFADYDANRDGVVRDNELLISIINNEGYGARRDAGRVKPSGTPVAWEGGVSLSSDSFDFHLTCHEMCHGLGATDIYGVWREGHLNSHLSMMSSGVEHLDPWHKLQFGWCEPQIVSLRAGGVATLPAAHSGQADAPLLLYDPSRGVNEFFLLEYRTPASTPGIARHYDQEVPGHGLVIWHVAHNASKDLRPYAEVAFPGAEQDWRECVHCGTLIRDLSNSKPCPSPASATERHQAFRDDRRLVKNNPAYLGQSGWRQCSKCAGLFYSPNLSVSRCPAGGQHAAASSDDYRVRMDAPDLVGHNHWRRCTSCQVLFLSWRLAEHGPTACPAGGQHTGAPNEYVILAGDERTPLAEGALGPGDASAFLLGGNTMWSGGTLTPTLTWYDGTSTRVQLYVHPFNTGAGAITVEWWADYDTWADFRYVGIEYGSFANPFNTLSEGLGAVSYGGNLHIKSSQTAEIAHITKRMSIEAYGGPVTLGR